MEEEEGGEDGGLGDVEAGPEGVFLDVAVNRRLVLIRSHTVGKEGVRGGFLGVSGGRRTYQDEWQRCRTWFLSWLLDRSPG